VSHNQFPGSPHCHCSPDLDSPTPRYMLLAHEEAGGSPGSVKSGSVTLSYTEPIPPNRESMNSQSNSTTTVDALPRIHPTTSQREAFTTSLALNPSCSSHPTHTPMPMVETQETAALRMSQEDRNDASELSTTLSSISRLNAAERTALVSMLTSVTRPGPSAGLTREDSVLPAPPPYGG
jgi:hypothetical protein